MHDWIKKQRKKEGFKAKEEDEPRSLSIHDLMTINITAYKESSKENTERPKTKKEEPKVYTDPKPEHKKASDIDPKTAKEVLRLMKTYSDKFQQYLWSLPLEEMIDQIFAMEKTISQIENTKEVTAEEALASDQDREFIDYAYDIPDSLMDEYDEYLEDHKFSFSKIDVIRSKFMEVISKKKNKKGKLSDKRGYLNLYDPLFHGVEGDMVAVRKNIRRLNAENKVRVDQFMDMIERLTGNKATHIPAIKAFKEKTDRIMKKTEQWLNETGLERKDLLFQF